MAMQQRIRMWITTRVENENAFLHFGENAKFRVF